MTVNHAATQVGSLIAVKTTGDTISTNYFIQYSSSQSGSCHVFEWKDFYPFGEQACDDHDTLITM